MKKVKHIKNSKPRARDLGLEFDFGIETEMFVDKIQNLEYSRRIGLAGLGWLVGMVVKMAVFVPVFSIGNHLRYLLKNYMNKQ